MTFWLIFDESYRFLTTIGEPNLKAWVYKTELHLIVKMNGFLHGHPKEEVYMEQPVTIKIYIIILLQQIFTIFLVRKKKKIRHKAIFYPLNHHFSYLLYWTNGDRNNTSDIIKKVKLNMSLDYVLQLKRLAMPFSDAEVASFGHHTERKILHAS
ncbi:hypothetical protein ACJX0J_008993 [Zea mays]